MTLGERIVQLRKALGWNQQRLVEASGVAAAVISNIETDEHQPMLRTLEKVRAAFGVTWDHLLAGVKFNG